MLSEKDPVDQIFIELIKFIFHRFDPTGMPTDKQLRNALNDFRKIKLGV